MIVLAIVLLFLLFMIGTHIGIAMTLVACLIMLMEGFPMVVVGQTAFKAVNSYALVAIPFFVLAGDLMARGRIAMIMIELIGSLVCVLRGGLALTVMLGSVFFAAVSGSSVASAAAIGSSCVDILRKERYPPEFGAGLVAVGGTLGLMIPPSLTFILIGSMIGLPIDKLFIAGIIPGLMEATLLCIVAVWISRRKGYGEVMARPDYARFRRSLGPAIPALLFPVLIMGTIYGGIFTPTEVSAVAAVYAALLGLFIYRTTNWRDLVASCKSATLSSAMIYLVVIGGSLLGFVLTRMGLGTTLVNAANAIDMQPWQFLIAVNIVLLILGMFVDGVSLIVLTAPILYQISANFDIDPIHLAVILTANVEIATLTPPIGLNLFVISGIAKLPVEKVARGVLPFYVTRLFALILLTYIPWFSLALIN